MSCESCEIAYINGMRCHETGCPESWRGLHKKCFECGCDFVPENSRFESVCLDCIADRERSSNEESE